MKKELIIAAYDKDISWIKSLNADVKIRIYRKGDVSSYENEIFLEKNVGRCVHTFFNHLHNNYDNLSDISFFCQDFPFDHWPNIIDTINNWDTTTGKRGSELNINGYWAYNPFLCYYNSSHFDDGRILLCDAYGAPHHPVQLDINTIWSKLFSIPPLNHYEFVPAGHFAITREHAQLRSQNFYGKIVELLENENNCPWEIERLESYIFDNKYTSIL